VFATCSRGTNGSTPASAYSLHVYGYDGAQQGENSSGGLRRIRCSYCQALTGMCSALKTSRVVYCLAAGGGGVNRLLQ